MTAWVSVCSEWYYSIEELDDSDVEELDDSEDEEKPVKVIKKVGDDLHSESESVPEVDSSDDSDDLDNVSVSSDESNL